MLFTACTLFVIIKRKERGIIWKVTKAQIIVSCVPAAVVRTAGNLLAFAAAGAL